MFWISAYRAATQSITYDEAATYNRYVSGSFQGIFNHYNANHHVLHTILCKLSVMSFGLSEFTLRLPSLMGGLLYLAVVYRLSRHLAGRTLTSVVLIGLLSLNPLIMDFLSVARGYSLALAFTLLGLYSLVLDLGERQSVANRPRELRHWIVAGVSFGLAISSNISFLFLVFGIVASFASFLIADRFLTADRASLRKAIPPRVLGRCSLLIIVYVVGMLFLVKAQMSLVTSPALRSTLIAINIIASLPILFLVMLDIVLLGDRMLRECLTLRLAVLLAFPIGAVAYPILARPLSGADLSMYYFGTAKLSNTSWTLVELSLRHHRSGRLISTDSPLFERLLELIAFGVIPAVLVITAVACGVIIRKGFRRRRFGTLERREKDVLFLGCSLLGTLLLYVLAHRAFDLAYPADRTGLWVIVMLVLSTGCTLTWLRRWKRLHAFAVAPTIVVCGILLVQFTLQLNLGAYTVWRYDAGTKRIVGFLSERHAATPMSDVRLAIEWQYNQSLRFYKSLYGLTWLGGIDYRGMRGYEFFGQETYDYYIYQDVDLEKMYGLRTIYLDEVSRARVGVAGGAGPDNSTIAP